MEQEQQKLCKANNTHFVPTPLNQMVGISENVSHTIFPINGLRHQIENGTSGWYIWAGEEFSNADNFFKPLHILHLQKRCPLVLKFMGLPPGWRFLIADEYEDVWFDQSLI